MFHFRRSNLSVDMSALASRSASGSEPHSRTNLTYAVASIDLGAHNAAAGQDTPTTRTDHDRLSSRR